jgi:membrane fusion protein (multidrug efflux system)
MGFVKGHPSREASLPGPPMQLNSLRISAAITLAATAMALAACGGGDKSKGQGGPGGFGGPAAVGYVVAKVEPVTLDSELSGRTSAYLISEVRPQVGGIVKARLFTEGAQVKAGQPLYQIDPATFQAGASSAKAAWPRPRRPIPPPS